MTASRSSAAHDGSADSLREIAQTYLRNNAGGEDAYLRFYRIQRSLPAAIKKAAMAELPGGKRFSHQRRIPSPVLRNAGKRLARVNLEAARNFEELHQLVSDTIGTIRGIGELTIYDTAHRIGAHLGLPPQHVYLHAGVRDGARALGLNHRAARLSMRELPTEFRGLRPEQVEDCLCIYKKRLAVLVAQGV